MKRDVGMVCQKVHNQAPSLHLHCIDVWMDETLYLLLDPPLFVHFSAHHLYISFHFYMHLQTTSVQSVTALMKSGCGYACMCPCSPALEFLSELVCITHAAMTGVITHFVPCCVLVVSDLISKKCTILLLFKC